MSDDKPLTTTTLTPPPSDGADGGGATNSYNTENAPAAAPTMNIAGMLASGAPPIFEALLNSLGVGSPPHAPLPTTPGAAYSALFGVTLLAHVFMHAYDTAASGIVQLLAALRLSPRRFSESEGGSAGAYTRFDAVERNPNVDQATLDAARERLRSRDASCQQELVNNIVPGPGLTPWHHFTPPAQAIQWGLMADLVPETQNVAGVWGVTLGGEDLNTPNQAALQFMDFLYEAATYCQRLARVWNRVFVAFFFVLLDAILNAMRAAERQAQGGLVAQAARAVPIPPIPFPTSDEVQDAWDPMAAALMQNRGLDLPHQAGANAAAYQGGAAPAMPLSGAAIDAIFPGTTNGTSTLEPTTGQLEDVNGVPLSAADMTAIGNATAGGLDFSAVLFGTAMNGTAAGPAPGTELSPLEEPPFQTAVLDLLNIASWFNRMTIDVTRRGQSSGNRTLMGVANRVTFPFTRTYGQVRPLIRRGPGESGDALERMLNFSFTRITFTLQNLFRGHIVPAPIPPPGAPATVADASLPPSAFLAYILALLVSRVTGGPGGWHSTYRKEL